MDSAKNFKTRNSLKETLEKLESEIAKEKHNLEGIIVNGENSFELDPRGEYDVLAHTLLEELNE